MGNDNRTESYALLLKQRDELLEALEYVVFLLEDHAYASAQRAACAAIAKAKS